MKSSKLWIWFKAVNETWPRPAIVFIGLSFAATLWWLWDALYDVQDAHELSWLEPLAAILGGIGAFLVAMFLIFRRINDAKDEADTYSLARGLATGYYFNFVRPLIGALRDPKHAVHTQVTDAGGSQVAGIVTGIPQSLKEFDPTNHDPLLMAALKQRGDLFTVNEIKVTVVDRPRPVTVKLAISRRTRAAILVDIPTTLAVIADFAGFVAKKESERSGSGDESVTAARTRFVASSETDQFREVLEQFLGTVNKVGAMEPRQLSPGSTLQIVPLNRVPQRMDELADH